MGVSSLDGENACAVEVKSSKKSQPLLVQMLTWAVLMCVAKGSDKCMPAPPTPGAVERARAPTIGATSGTEHGGYRRRYDRNQAHKEYISVHKIEQ